MNRITSLANWVKRISYSVLIAVIIIVANLNDESLLTNTLWLPLRLINLDISMTPFTTDMNFMSPEEGSYARLLSLKVWDSTNREYQIDPRDLSVGITKMPFLLMSEASGEGFDINHFVGPVCRAMSYELNIPVGRFEFRAEPSRSGDQNYLVNRPITCEVEI